MPLRRSRTSYLESSEETTMPTELDSLHGIVKLCDRATCTLHPTAVRDRLLRFR
jgi:hypothetical protein